MKKNLTKALALFLSVLMVFSCVPLSGIAMGTPAEEADTRASRILDFLDNDLLPNVIGEDEGIILIEDDEATPDVDETVALHSTTADGLVAEIVSLVDTDKFGGSFDNINVEELRGLTRASAGDTEFFYSLVEFIADNEDLFADFVTGELDYGNFSSLIPEEMIGWDLYDLLMELFRDSMNSAFGAENLETADDVFYSLLENVFRLLAENMGVTESAMDDLTVDLQVRTNDLYGIINAFISDYYDGTLGTILGELTVALRNALSYMTDEQLDFGDSCTRLTSGDVYADVKAAYEAAYHPGDCAAITVDGQKYYGYYDENARLVLIPVATGEDYNKADVLGNFNTVQQGEAAYNTLRALLGLVNPDFVFNPSMIDIAGNIEAYGGVVEQLNALVADIADILLSDFAKENTNWIDGSNDFLNSNLASLVEFVMPYIAAFFNTDFYSLSFFDNEIFTAGYYENYDLATFAADFVRVLVNFVYDEEYADEQDDFFCIPSNAATLNCEAAIALNYCFKMIGRNIGEDFVMPDFTLAIYTDETKTAVRELSDEEWNAVSLDIAVSFLMELTIWARLPFAMTQAQFDEYRAAGWGYMETLDELVDRFYIYYLDGLIVPEYPIVTELGVLDHNGPWYKISAFLDSLLPLGILNNCSKTYPDPTDENNTVELPFDIGVLLEDRILGDLLDADISGVLSVLTTNEDGANLFYQNNLERAALLTVQKLVNAVLPGTVKEEDITSFDHAISNETLAKLVRQLIRSVNNRKEQLLPPILAWADALGVLDNCPAKSADGNYRYLPNTSWFCGENTPNTATIVEYTGNRNVTALAIPETIDGYTVTGIGAEGSPFSSSEKSPFDDAYNLQSVTIPATVTNISDYAFRNIDTLTTVTFAEGTTIDEIGSYAFAGDISLANIVIPETVTYIGACAFYNTAITAITIPAGVTSIGREAFYHCSDLASVTFAEGSALGSVGSNAFCCCSALTSIDIPDGVTEIRPYTFAYCMNLQNVTLGDAVTYIGECAFLGTALINNATENGIYIGNYLIAYMDLDGTHELNIREGTTLIAASPCAVKVTENTSTSYYYSHTYYSYTPYATIETISIPASVTTVCGSIESGVYVGYDSICRTVYRDENSNSYDSYRSYYTNSVRTTLQAYSVAEANTLYTSEDGVLYNKAKTAIIDYPDAKPDVSFVIPDSVTSINSNTFYSAYNLQNVTIGAGITSLYSGMFNNSGLCAFAVSPLNTRYSATDGMLLSKNGETLEIIPRNWLTARSSTTVTVPASVKYIANDALCYVNNITKLVLPAGLVTWMNTVVGLYGLTEISIDESAANFKTTDGILYNKTGTKLIKYPAAKAGASFSIPEGVVTVASQACYNADFTEVIFPSTLRTIESEAFRNAAVTDVVLPDSVTTLGYSVFSDCYGLEHIRFGNGITKIPSNVVYNSYKLESVEFGNAVTGIDDYAFAYCRNLTDIVIPDTVKNIDNCAFYNCDNLTAVTLGSNLKEICSYAFYNCGFVTIVIPASVDTIGNSAFSNYNGMPVVLMGVPGTYAETYAKKNYYDFCPLDGSLVTLKTLPETDSGTLTVYGTALPGSVVKVYDGTHCIGSTTADTYAKWRATVSLYSVQVWDNDIGGYVQQIATGEHTLIAIAENDNGDDSVSEEVTVNYDPVSSVFESLSFSHYNWTVNVSAETLGTMAPYKTWVPGRTSSLSVKLSNSADLSVVYVLSTKGVGKEKEVRKLRLQYAGDDTWVGTGYFDNANFNYVPGTISVIAFDADGNKLNYGVSIKFRFLIDPSGYVYEAVLSNRVEGATASIWYQDEEGTAQLWEDAADTDQECEQTTPEDGSFAWVVPEGTWQVKVTKDGYEDAYSDWMEIPPEVTNLAIPLMTTVAPEIEDVNIYADGVEVYFDQYMDISTITTSSVTVSEGGSAVTGTWTALDAEACGWDENISFAKAFRFTPDEGRTFTSEVTVSVAGDSAIKNYAGIAFNTVYSTSASPADAVADFTADATLALDMTDVKAGTINLHASNAAGKLVTLTLENSYVADISTVPVTFDEDGNASISVTALVPGQVTVTFGIKGTILTATTTVTVGTGIHEHTFGTYTTVQEPTCAKEGYKIATCSECGIIDIEIIPVTDTHNTASVEAAGYCTKAGNKAYTYCPDCGLIQTIENEDVSANNWNISTDADKITVAALGHNEVIDEAYESTCGRNGRTQGSHCDRCNMILVEQESLPKVGTHQYVTTVIEPEIGKKGYTLHKCSVCGKEYYTDEKPALTHEHKYTSVVTAPGCTTKGYTTYTCDCGDTYIADETPAKGHTPAEDWIIDEDSTCAKTGSKHRICTTCKQTIETAEIAKKEHKYTAVVTAPGCTTGGYTTYTCTCGDTYVADETPATGHTDANGDNICDTCGKDLTKPQSFFDKIKAFFQSIIDFFKNLFK